VRRAGGEDRGGEIEFRASSERLADETCLVSVAGELDLYTAPEFERALGLNGGANGPVVVDLSECTFIGSTGLGILVQADRHIGGNALLIVAAGPEVLRAFEASGLDHRFSLHPSLESAQNGHAARGWRDKEVRNQALFREVNERIEQLADDFGTDGQNRLICECGNPECTQQIELSAAEYEQVRAHASRFVVALNHENPETESIVEQNDRFAVVETYAGARSRIARETDPRSQQHLRRTQAAAAEGRGVAVTAVTAFELLHESKLTGQGSRDGWFLRVPGEACPRQPTAPGDSGPCSSVDAPMRSPTAQCGA
jgi:anti-sigma B factor antagonist